MTDAVKDTLLDYLRRAREALLWKLDGLDEYAVRRPLTPTGTNLLGLVKHATYVESGYFGETFGRPYAEPAPWDEDPDVDPNADLYARADESRSDVVDRYRRVWAHADETIATLDLDSPGRVPWWSEERRDVTLHRVLVHVIADLQRHAGHADVLREGLDGQAGLLPAVTNLPEDGYDWPAHVARVAEAARGAAEAAGERVP